MRCYRFNSFPIPSALLAIIFLSFMSPTPGYGQESPLRIHGYLTQAIARSWPLEGPLVERLGSTSVETDLGIPVNATTNYRSLALLFRYELSKRSNVSMQISHEKVGDAPSGDYRDNLELDWAFFEQKIGDRSSIRVGRFPISFGIYNQIRDVGLLLPFYRPSFAVYAEGAFVTETADGVELSHRFEPRGRWQASVDLHWGSFKSLEAAPTDRSGHQRGFVGGCSGSTILARHPSAWIAPRCRVADQVAFRRSGRPEGTRDPKPYQRDSALTRRRFRDLAHAR